MRFASLGSGSEGNGLVVQAGDTCVMIDCGFGIRETSARLGRLGLVAEDITAIIVTHEHSDHVGGVPAFAARHGTPVWATWGTISMAGRLAGIDNVNAFDSHDAFAIGALSIEPFPVPHDAREPVQYVLGDGARRIGVLTDIGASTPHVEACVSGCDALVLECNHDVELLAKGPYPYPLKQRIAGPFGHLSNADAAAMLARIDVTKLQHIVAAHLSRENNTPDSARAALCAVLECSPDWIGVADQAHGFGWREVS